MRRHISHTLDQVFEEMERPHEHPRTLVIGHDGNGWWIRTLGISTKPSPRLDKVFVWLQEALDKR